MEAEHRRIGRAALATQRNLALAHQHAIGAAQHQWLALAARIDPRPVARCIGDSPAGDRGQPVARLASHGFIVVRADPAFSLFSPDHAAMAADAQAVIDWALSSSSPIAESVDATRVATMGHSLGGKLAIMTAFADPRVKAVFGIDPVNAQSPNVVPDQVSPLTIPLGFAGETLDAATGAGGMACAPADGNYVTFYNAAARSPWSAEWTFPGISHLAFVDSCTGLLCSFCKTSTADEGIARSNLKTLAVAFFRRHFWSDTAMESTLTGAAAPVGVTTRHQ